MSKPKLHSVRHLVPCSALLAGLLAYCVGPVGVTRAAEDLPDTVATVKRSVVGVGTMQYTRRPPGQFMGTGFAVGDGNHIITNAHVLSEATPRARNEFLAVFVGNGRNVEARRATKVGEDQDHDLALLKIEGYPIQPMQLGGEKTVREGELYAFTGFPMGAILGMYPATHRGIVASITPIVITDGSEEPLDARRVRGQRSPYDVYQLDATAYPGNSGSPMYHPHGGAVVGVINKVLVKSKGSASALRSPSGITYAIPVIYVHDMLRDAGLMP